MEWCGELLLLLLLRESVEDEAAALGWGQIMKIPLRLFSILYVVELSKCIFTLTDFSAPRKSYMLM